jgi:hypothetical protein
VCGLVHGRMMRMMMMMMMHTLEVWSRPVSDKAQFNLVMRLPHAVVCPALPCLQCPVPSYECIPRPLKRKCRSLAQFRLNNADAQNNKRLRGIGYCAKQPSSSNAMRRPRGKKKISQPKSPGSPRARTGEGTIGGRSQTPTASHLHSASSTMYP